MTTPQLPTLTVNCLLLTPEGLVTLKQEGEANTLPGGLVRGGESCFDAATNALAELFPKNEVQPAGVLGMYDDPKRVTDKHVVSVVYVFKTDSTVVAPEGVELTLVTAMADLPPMQHDFGKMVGDFEKMLKLQQEQAAQQGALQQMMQKLQAENPEALVSAGLQLGEAVSPASNEPGVTVDSSDDTNWEDENTGTDVKVAVNE